MDNVQNSTVTEATSTESDVSVPKTEQQGSPQVASSLSDAVADSTSPPEDTKVAASTLSNTAETKSADACPDKAEDAEQSLSSDSDDCSEVGSPAPTLADVAPPVNSQKPQKPVVIDQEVIIISSDDEDMWD